MYVNYAARRLPLLRKKYMYIYPVNLTKRIVVFFLCLQIAVPQHLQTDLLRLPMFVTHFFHHNEHHKSVAFLDYLKEHVSENIHHDDSHDEHEQLPFHNHSHDCTTHQIQLAFISIKDFSIQPVSVQSSKVRSIYKQTYFPSNHFASVWRPPKLS